MNMERRNHLRKATDDFAFVQLDRENGGLVLNVSEGGLRFRANTPILQASPIYVWFWLNIGDRIEAVAETAWTDEARKEGGLRFARLSETARSQIRTFLRRSDLPATRTDAALPPPTPTLVPPAPQSGKSTWDVSPSPAPAALWEPEAPPSPPQTSAASWQEDAVPFIHEIPAIVSQSGPAPSPRETPSAPRMPVAPSPPRAPSPREVSPAPARSDRAPSPRKAPPPPSFRFSTIPEKPEMEMEHGAALITVEQYQGKSRLSFFGGFFVGILVSALAAIPLFVILTRHANSGAPQNSPSSSSLAQSQPQATSASSGPSYPPNPAPSGKPKKSVPSARSTDLSPAPEPLFPQLQSRPRAAQPASGSSAAPLTAQTATAAVNPPRVAPHAVNDLQIPVQPANNSPFSKMTPERLWAAVKEGNARAEVALADLYLHGDGVPQNCDQARVLLTAAAQKKFPEAIKKLQQLDEQGCPSD